MKKYFLLTLLSVFWDLFLTAAHSLRCAAASVIIRQADLEVSLNLPYDLSNLWTSACIWLHQRRFFIWNWYTLTGVQGLEFVYQGQRKNPDIRERESEDVAALVKRAQWEKKNTSKIQLGCHKHDPGYISGRSSSGWVGNLFNHGFLFSGRCFPGARRINNFVIITVLRDGR